MGVFAHLAQYFMTLALHSDVASKIAPWNYFGAIFAIIFGYFFFDEKVALLSIFGMILVIVSVILNSRVQTKPND
jgi:drug/metabolite transporter (DMT)-like permease